MLASRVRCYVPGMTPDELRAYRRINGLSQLNVADALSTSPVTVSRWESGKLPLPTWLTLSTPERACEAMKKGAPLRWVHQLSRLPPHS